MSFKFAVETFQVLCCLYDFCVLLWMQCCKAFLRAEPLQACAFVCILMSVSVCLRGQAKVRPKHFQGSALKFQIPHPFPCDQEGNSVHLAGAAHLLEDGPSADYLHLLGHMRSPACAHLPGQRPPAKKHTCLDAL